MIHFLLLYCIYAGIVAYFGIEYTHITEKTFLKNIDVMTLPFGYVANLGYLIIPVVAFVFYVLVSLELIAEEIEDPFGEDENDLPTDLMARNIKNNIEDIL